MATLEPTRVDLHRRLDLYTHGRGGADLDALYLASARVGGETEFVLTLKVPSSGKAPRLPPSPPERVNAERIHTRAGHRLEIGDVARSDGCTRAEGDGCETARPLHVPP